MNKLKVIPDQQDPFFIVLLWEENPWKKLYKFFFFKKLKPLFSVSSLEEAEQTFLSIEEKVAKTFAVNSLTKKAFLTSELKAKMQERGLSEESIDYAICFCRRIGALRDQEVLMQRIQKELKKGRSLAYARAKWQRSLGTEVIEWDSSENKELEKAALHKMIQKQRKRKDLFLFLRKKGFRSDLIQEALKAHSG